MSRLICLTLSMVVLTVGRAIAESPAPSCLYAPQGIANLVLIDDMAVFSEKQLVLKQTKGPAVT